MGWLAEHATTRVGPRGRQVQVPVQEIDAALVRHYTSRAGRPAPPPAPSDQCARMGGRQMAGPAHGGSTRQPRRPERHRTRSHAMPIPPSEGTRRARLHPRRLASGEVRARPRTPARSALAPRRSAGTSSDMRRSGAPSTPARSRDRGCVGPGTHAPGLTHDWTRWCRATAPSWLAAGSRSWHDRFSARPPSLLRCRRRASGSSTWGAFVEVALTRLGARRSGWNAADVRGEVERRSPPSDLAADPATRAELTQDLHRLGSSTPVCRS